MAIIGAIEGQCAMELVEDVIDNGAPEYAVTGIAAIERISPGQVRVTKFMRRRGENIVTHHEIWDLKLWLRALAPYEEAMRLIASMPAIENEREERRPGRH